MDTQTNPTPETIPVKKNRYETLDERTSKIKLAFGNAMLPNIFLVMQTVGYTAEKITSMSAKLELFETLQRIRTKEYAEQLAETEKFDNKHDEIDVPYNKHRSLLRISLKGDTLDIKTLRLTETVPTAYPAWEKMVSNFYSQIMDTPDLLAKAQTVGITPEVITGQKQALIELQLLKQSQRKEIGEAVAATEARDHAFDEVNALYTEYTNYAKVLLADNQALKAIGLKVN